MSQEEKRRNFDPCEGTDVNEVSVVPPLDLCHNTNSYTYWAIPISPSDSFNQIDVIVGLLHPKCQSQSIATITIALNRRML